jgi:hypothetical protein
MRYRKFFLNSSSPIVPSTWNRNRVFEFAVKESILFGRLDRILRCGTRPPELKVRYLPNMVHHKLTYEPLARATTNLTNTYP